MTNKFQTRKSATEVTNSRAGKAEHEVKHTEKKHFTHKNMKIYLTAVKGLFDTLHRSGPNSWGLLLTFFYVTPSARPQQPWSLDSTLSCAQNDFTSVALRAITSAPLAMPWLPHHWLCYDPQTLPVACRVKVYLGPRVDFEGLITNN
jgi:hypothetical protein